MSDETRWLRNVARVNAATARALVSLAATLAANAERERHGYTLAYGEVEIAAIIADNEITASDVLRILDGE